MNFELNELVQISETFSVLVYHFVLKCKSLHFLEPTMLCLRGNGWESQAAKDSWT